MDSSCWSHCSLRSSSGASCLKSSSNISRQALSFFFITPLTGKIIFSHYSLCRFEKNLWYSNLKSVVKEQNWSGPFLVGSHLMTTWVWFSTALVSTIISHSGYHLPLLPSPQYHDYHHLKYNQCYGVLGLLDYIHGTDKIFRSVLISSQVCDPSNCVQTKQFQRNKFLLSSSLWQLHILIKLKNYHNYWSLLCFFAW